MRVHFRNSYYSKVWVAIMYWDPEGCADAGNWGTAGWWAINPGDEVWAFSTSNRYACFYAEADDGAIWAGNYGPVYVRLDEAFNLCVDIAQSGPPGEVVGMRLVDVGSSWWPWAYHTVNLTP